MKRKIYSVSRESRVLRMLKLSPDDNRGVDNREIYRRAEIFPSRVVVYNLIQRRLAKCCKKFLA